MSDQHARHIIHKVTKVPLDDGGSRWWEMCEPGLQGMWKVAGRSVGDSNKDDPSLVDHGSVRKECHPGKQGLRKVREPVSGRGGGRAPVSYKGIQDLYVLPKSWARMAPMVRGRKAQTRPDRTDLSF